MITVTVQIRDTDGLTDGWPPFGGDVRSKRCVAQRFWLVDLTVGCV
jgi:hypothetical protein